MSEDAEQQEAETEVFGDELSDEALDRLPAVAASSSGTFSPCACSPGAVAVPARQT